MIGISQVMETLARQRAVYHSEADFQHAFAWELHRQLPELTVRLERPFKANGKSLHLDLFVEQQGASLAVQLKYKTRILEHRIENEEFRLTSHGASDHGRYDFIKDIHRLEQIGANLERCIGWAILLTNDSAYWKQPNRSDTIDAAFRLHDGRGLDGELAWASNAGSGTTKGRKHPVNLNHRYPLRWQEFSDLGVNSYGKFRFLAVKVC